MHNTFELDKYLRSNIENPYNDLCKKYLLDNKVNINVEDIKEITKLSKYAFFIRTYKNEYIVSFVMNKDKLKEFEVKKFNLIILCRKYNKIYYDVQIINVDDVE